MPNQHPALLVIVFTIAGHFASAQTPGGVATPTVWLKANTATAGKITYDGSNRVSSWISEANPSSSNPTYAVTQTVGDVTDPIYNSTSTIAGNFNYNPFLQFNSGNLTLLQNAATTDLAGTAGSIFVVANNNGYTGAENPSSLTFTTSTGADALQRYQVKPFRVYTGVSSTNLTSNVAITIPGTDLQASAAITASAGSYTTLTGRRNAVAGTLTSYTNGTSLPLIATGLYVGGNSGKPTEYADQGIAEVIMYNSTLTAANINKVESYLAIKYGLTLGSGTAVNYVNSSGTTIWTGDATYQYDMVGVGLDNGSGLSQFDSHSVNTSNGDGTGQSGKGNIELDATGSIATNNSFLLTGHTSTAITSTQTTDVPSGIANRLTRLWKTSETGTVGTVTLSFDITGLSAFAGRFVRLLLGTTTTIASATTYAPSAINGNIISFSVPFATGTQYFTFAMSAVAPGGVSAGNTLWLKADKNTSTTTQGAAVTLWEDNVGSYDFGTSATATRRPTYTNQSADNYNYNPSMKFVTASQQYFQTTVQYASDKFVNMPPVSGNIVGSVFGVASVTSSGSGADIITQWSTALNDYNFNINYYSNVFGGGIPKAGNITAPSTLPSLINSANIMEVDRTSGGGSYTIIGRMNGKKGTGSVGTILRQSPNYVNIGVNAPAVGSSWMNGNTAEFIIYNVQITGLNMVKIQSYLAIKYGITMDSTGIAADLATQAYYVSSSGTNLYYGGGTGSAYWRNIIGIGRDDLDSLYQKQSRQLDDSVRLYSTGLAATNIANASTYTDNTFVMMGSNSGKLCSDAATATEKPATVDARLDREWKVVNTGFTNTYRIDLKLSCPIGDDDDMKVLVDADGNFTDASVITPGTGGGVNSMTYNRTTKLVTIEIDPSGGAIPSGSMKYITIATRTFQILPVDLVSFDAVLKGTTVQLNWQTASETNHDYFQVQRSPDASVWHDLQVIKSKGGNSSSTNTYQTFDSETLAGICYYRLKQADRDGKITFSANRLINTGNLTNAYTIYPNPVKNRVIIKWNGNNAPASIALYSSNGQLIPVSFTRGSNEVFIPSARLAKGLYILNITNKNGDVVKKKIVKE